MMLFVPAAKPAARVSTTELILLGTDPKRRRGGSPWRR